MNMVIEERILINYFSHKIRNSNKLRLLSLNIYSSAKVQFILDCAAGFL